MIMLSVEQTLDLYIAELDASYASQADADPMADAALEALCRAVDDEATQEDVAALSAWAARQRILGAHEADTVAIVKVIEHLRSKPLPPTHVHVEGQDDGY